MLVGLVVLLVLLVLAVGLVVMRVGRIGLGLRAEHPFYTRGELTRLLVELRALAAQLLVLLRALLFLSPPLLLLFLALLALGGRLICVLALLFLCEFARQARHVVVGRAEYGHHAATLLFGAAPLGLEV
jgi:hypothetical protein